jgi:hypothetical protein
LLKLTISELTDLLLISVERFSGLLEHPIRGHTNSNILNFLLVMSNSCQRFE